MASTQEIGHARHRRELVQQLQAVIEKHVVASGARIVKGESRLSSYDGSLKGYTIREQALQSFSEFSDGSWIRIDIASTGESWDALIVFTSSNVDRSVIVHQGTSSAPAIETLEEVLKELKKP